MVGNSLRALTGDNWPARLAASVRALPASHAPLWKRACGPWYASWRWLISVI